MDSASQTTQTRSSSASLSAQAARLVRSALMLLAVLLVSFWGRALWDARLFYDSGCRQTPTAACVEDLRRAASWAAPLNSWAEAALIDLDAIASDLSVAEPLRWAATEGAMRARASSRSMLSQKLAPDPHPFFSVAATALFWGWIGSLFWCVWSMFSATGKLLGGRRSLFMAALSLAFYCGWLLALARA